MPMIPTGSNAEVPFEPGERVGFVWAAETGDDPGQHLDPSLRGKLVALLGGPAAPVTSKGVDPWERRRVTAVRLCGDDLEFGPV